MGVGSLHTLFLGVHLGQDPEGGFLREPHGLLLVSVLQRLHFRVSKLRNDLISPLQLHARAVDSERDTPLFVAPDLGNLDLGYARGLPLRPNTGRASSSRFMAHSIVLEEIWSFSRGERLGEARPGKPVDPARKE